MASGTLLTDRSRRPDGVTSLRFGEETKEDFIQFESRLAQVLCRRISWVQFCYQ